MKLTPVRRRIPETATRLFYREGYGLAGIHEIIARAGVAKTSLYRRFSPKAEPCVAFLAQKEQECPAGLRAFPESHPGDGSRLPSCVQASFMQVYSNY